MSNRAANLRAWVLRTIGQSGSSLNDIHHHFSVQFPHESRRSLEEILENHRDVVSDDQGRVELSDEARRELEEISRQDASRRARDA